MITAKSMIGRPSNHAPNYVNVWFAHDSCPNLKLSELNGQTPNVSPDTGFDLSATKVTAQSLHLTAQTDKSILQSDRSRGTKRSAIIDAVQNSDTVKVDLDCYLGQKVKSSKLSSHRKKSKRQEKWTLTNESSLLLPDDEKFRSKTVEDALKVIENRKKTIKAKLLVRKEHLLTQEEEQDIHTRADLYAITTVPDTKYCVLSTVESIPNSVVRHKEFHEEDTYQPVRKRRRRNYGNTNCFVTHHNDDDIFDNTKMLPIGTRLLKPPTKLVELVALAISGSPDGLLQVQQIYTFLQNKYPFFRYMDRVAINSWRSSIRHALYQKWFRKIRFDSSFISNKGCYWAINKKSNPKEWSLPGELDSDEMKTNIEEDQTNEDTETQEIKEIAKKLLSADEASVERSSCDQCGLSSAVENQTDHIPSPVKDQDPILSTCTATWNNEDMSISSNESGHGTMTPLNSPSYPAVLYLTQESQDFEIKADLILGTPLITSPNSAADFRPLSDIVSNEPKNTTQPSELMCKTNDISPIVNWTPDWDEYGSYIISPQNLATLKYVQSLPGDKAIDSNSITCIGVQEESTDADTLSIKTECSFFQNHESSPINHSCESDTESCGFEIIAEYTKSDFQLNSELGL